jgi:putative membrane protein
MSLIINWFLSAIALYIVAHVVPGVMIADFGTALVAAIIVGLLNAIVKPILVVLTLPINFLTLGLFTFIINALVFMLAGSITPNFQVDGLGAGLIGSLLLTLISTVLHTLIA